MGYAIVLNLNYENYPHKRCRLIWEAIKASMQKHGFRKDGRTFTIRAASGEASALARHVVEDLALVLNNNGINLYAHIKDFYGYELAHATNLLVPPTDSIQVNEERHAAVGAH